MRTAAASLWFLLLAGCAATREPSQITADLSPEEIIKIVNAQPQTIATMTASGSVSVESPEFSNSANVDIMLRRPDSVRIKVNGPFGIHLASILFSKNHFLLYNSFSNEVMEGDVAFDRLPPFLNLHVDAGDILDTFCATRMFDDDETHPDSFIVTGDTYSLKFRHGNQWVGYSVDGTVGRISTITHIDSAGTISLKEIYEYRQTEDGAIVPQSFAIVQEGLEASISLYYESVTLNNTIRALTLEIPNDARKRLFEGFQQRQ
jgi:hypothetical protein